MCFSSLRTHPVGSNLILTESKITVRLFTFARLYNHPAEIRTSPNVLRVDIGESVFISTKEFQLTEFLNKNVYATRKCEDSCFRSESRQIENGCTDTICVDVLLRLTMVGLTSEYWCGHRTYKGTLHVPRLPRVYSFKTIICARIKLAELTIRRYVPFKASLKNITLM